MNAAEQWVSFFEKVGSARLASMRRPLVIVEFDGLYIARRDFKPHATNDNRRRTS